MVGEEGQSPDRPRHDRRRELLLAAYKRIAAMGLEGLRTRDVAGDVGVNVATLHYYFPTKEALIQAVVAHAMSRFASTLPAAKSPTERLRGHLARVRHLLHEEPELFAVVCELAMRASRDPQVAGLVRGTQNPWHAAVREMLKRGAQEGGLVPDLNPDDAAALVVSAITGMSVPSVDPRRAERIDQTFRQLERWLGLGGEPS
jgi:AcrR family transcriptional regulator